ncbi:MAG: AzlC family ABC transporter permease [Rhodospirillaceae bacterium]
MTDHTTTRSSPIALTAQGVARGFKRLMPIALFVIPFGSAFGVAALEAGLSASDAMVMSVVAFSGAAQFASLEFLTEPVAVWTLALVLLALNARHVIMGAALSQWINHLPPAQRLAAVILLSDANFADSQPSFKAGDRDIGLLLGGGLALWVTWVLGTAIGVLGGTVFGDLDRYGVDVVMPCFFVAAVVGRLGSDRSMVAPVIAASIVAAATVDLLPTGWNVILGAVIGGLVALWPSGAGRPRQ